MRKPTGLDWSKHDDGSAGTSMPINDHTPMKRPPKPKKAKPPKPPKVAKVKATPTHCVHGHEFTPENTYWNKKRGYQVCRTCQRANAKRYNDRNRKPPKPKVRPTHCKRDHELTPENTRELDRISAKGTPYKTYQCRECERFHGRENTRKRRAAAKQAQEGTGSGPRTREQAA